MIKDILDYIWSLLKSRLIPLVIVFIVLFTLLINRLFTLQIVNGESYVRDLTDAIQMQTSVSPTRGRIFDRNGVLLAYNDLAYAVKISDSGKYKNDEIKNETLNNAIDKTLNIIEEKGDKYSNDFKIEYLGNDIYGYTVSDTSLLRFLRDTYGKKSINDLEDEQKNATANQTVEYLCKFYGITEGQFTPEHTLKILSLRQSMYAKYYSRYMTFTIASEVSDETVAAILENSDELVGVTVEEQYIRRYVDSQYCSQILGYTGSISSTELADMNVNGEIYEPNDVIGKTGIEKTLESELAGTKGTKTVYVDTVGRITQVLDQTDPVAGKDVYLTIDINLQKQIYNAIEDELVSIILSKIVDGDTKYTYSSKTGKVDNIYIPIKEVYFSLIDNNIISLKKLPAATSDNEINVYNTFLSKQSSVIEWLNSELNGRPTAYGKLSEEQQVYVWYVYKMLQKQGIFNTSAVDTNDEVYKQWEDENSVSLAEILKYAISQNWIDMSTLTDQKYTSLQESYDALVSYIDTVLKTDNDFSKKMYKYMIQTGQLSGREICMMLYEQGVLEDHGEYAALSAGSMSSYNFMIDAITTKKITPAQLALKPCSGSCVMTDPNNGDVIALVSYPSYDNNKLSGSVDAEYYSQLNSDKSKPLQNWATQSQSAPGSTFKPCAAIAALDTGLISTSSTYYCSGTFDKVTPPPSCWQTWGHGSQNVTQAIQHSCNVFFYNVGYDLACSRNGQYDSNYGTSILQKYAESLGLATESGIEIEESTPQASNILAFASAMGQGNHNYSCLNIARYATTLAANGTCYNLTLIDKVTDHDGNLIRDNEAKVSNTVEISSANWDAVHQGMKLAADEYFASSRLGITIAGKSGTAQESSKDPDHSLLMTYAPYENPKVATAVEIQNGYTSGTSIELTAQIYRIYLSLYPTE